MASTVTVGQEMENRILDAVRKSNTFTAEAVKMVVDAVRPMTADLQMMTPPLFYDLVEQLIVSERKFAEEMLRAIAHHPVKA